MERAGRHRLIEEVGRGGAGSVWRALAPDGTPLAVKLLLSGREADPLQRRRFATEVQALIRVRHPNVVSIFDAGEQDGTPWLAMEWVEGETLAARLARVGALEPEAVIALGAKLAAALAHCHAQGLLHRDLKPANVILRKGDDEPLLTDFGLARDLDRSDDDSGSTTLGRSIRGRWMGTPGFWPPEQARGELEKLDARSDVYGLCALLFAGLTGRPPQTGETLVALIASLERPPPRPGPLSPYPVPAWLDAAIVRGLDPDPAQRHATMDDLARELAERRAPASGGRSRRPLLIASALGVAGIALAVTARAASRDPAPPPVEDAAEREAARHEAALANARSARARALQVWQSSWRDRDVVLAAFDRALEAARVDRALEDEVRVDRARYLLRRGLLDQAIEECARVGPGRARLQAALIQSRALLWQGWWSEAMDVRLRLAREAQDLPEGMVARATFLLSERSRDYDLAAGEQLVRRALELDPECGEAGLLAAHSLACKGDVPGALAELDRQAKRAPDDPAPFMERMLLQIRSSDPRGSDQSGERALELIRPSPAGFVWLVRAMHVINLSPTSTTLAMRDFDRCEREDASDYRPRLYRLAVFVATTRDEEEQQRALALLRAFRDERPAETERFHRNIPVPELQQMFRRMLGPERGRRQPR